jgi:hypothetical protein
MTVAFAQGPKTAASIGIHQVRDVEARHVSVRQLSNGRQVMLYRHNEYVMGLLFPLELR